MDWIPDVTRPVFYGRQDLDVADGARRPLRIWYPSVDGSPPGAPILKHCVARWPLVLFLHGQPPPPCEPFPMYYRSWEYLPVTLARSGYVVVVPQHAYFLPDDKGPDSERDAAIDDLNWARNDWINARWVDPRPQATAVAGHSYGALLGQRVVRARPEIAAFVSLSGTWRVRPRDLDGVSTPSLFMWARHDAAGPGSLDEDLDYYGLWDRVSAPKYAAVFEGEHFDYVPQLCGGPMAHAD